MSRSIPVRWPALGLFVALWAPGAGAQDAAQIATDAQAKLGEIQKALASGKDLPDKDGKQKDVPDWQRLRIDGFKAAGGQIKVTGVFLDTGIPPTASDPWSPTFGAIRNDLEKMILATATRAGANVDFDWRDLTRVGGVTRAVPDGDWMGRLFGGRPVSAHLPPHVAVQAAANAAGGAKDPAKRNPAADRLVLTGARFGAGGELILTGLRDEDAAVLAWLAGGGAEALKGHPAAGTKPVGWGGVTAAEWAVGVPALRRLLAATDDNEKALRRLYVDRAYFTVEPTGADPDGRWNRFVFQVEGIQIGTGGVVEERPRKVIEPVVRGLVKTALVDCTALVEGAVPDPVAALRLAVAKSKKLDGVRVDPGFYFGPKGELVLAGIQPELDAPAREELEAVVRTTLAASGRDTKTHGEFIAAKYAQLADRPVSAAGMTPLPIGKVIRDLRAWAIRYRDDVRLRLYFIDDLQTVADKRHIVAENGGGLVLVYQIADAADGPAIDARFNRLFAEHFPKGLPDIKLSGTAGKNKEPLLPGLTAELRRVVASDPKEWYGVLIARGSFDAAGRYTVAGAVDAKAQNAKLGALLKRLAADDKWKKTYFASETGDDLPPNAPDLPVIPMAEMLDKVRRVTPAYPVFDGLRVEKVGYDARANLVFEAHAVGPVTADMEGKLAELLVDPKSPFRLRVIRPEQERPKVQIKPVSGPPYPDDQVANFSLAFGARLLAKAGAGAADRAAAKAWLDAALLHYPNEAAVWFLSAQYNFLYGDENPGRRHQMVRRDLFRTIDLEGVLAFNGPAQRKRRYEAARDFQGTARNELEELWLKCFREAKDGAKPLTLDAVE